MTDHDYPHLTPSGECGCECDECLQGDWNCICQDCNCNGESHGEQP